jgi:Mg-chelatase subunit ChlD
MNPEHQSPQELEARITALLLGELEAAEAEEVRTAIERDPELGRLRDRLQQTFDLVREATAAEPGPTAPQIVSQLSEARRAELLMRFKTVALPEPAGAWQRWSWVIPMAAAAGLTLVLSVLSLWENTRARSSSAAWAKADGEELASLSVDHPGGPTSAIRPPDNHSRGYGPAEPALREALAATDEMRRRGISIGAGVETEGRLARRSVGRQLAEVGTTVAGVAEEEKVGLADFSDANGRLMLRRYGTFVSPTKPATTESLAQARRDQSGAAPPSVTPMSVARGDQDPDDSLRLILDRSPFQLRPPSANGMTAERYFAENAPDIAHFGGLGSGGGFGGGGGGAGTSDVKLRSRFVADDDTATRGRPDAAEAESARAGTSRIAGDFEFLWQDFEADSFDLASIPGGIPGTSQHWHFDASGESAVQLATPDHLRVPSLGDRPIVGRRLALQGGTAPSAVAGQDLYESVKEPLPKLETASKALPTVGANVERLEELARPEGAPTGSALARIDELFAEGVSVPAEVTLGYDVALQEDTGVRSQPSPLPEPQPEVMTAEQPFSTFSLNVSDVSFKLAAASLENGVLPDPATIRSEEFINAFDYRDPETASGAAIALAWERGRYPFAHNRDLLRLSVRTAAEGRALDRPLNLVLLLDSSGSMERADRVRIIHEAMRVLAAQIQPRDRVSVVSFARTPRLWVDGLPGTEAAELPARVGELTPEGGTNLEEALKLAYETAARHFLAGGENRVVLLTDGAANLGDVEPQSLRRQVEAHRLKGIALDCFGIGWEGYNDDLLEVLSRHGDGRYGFVSTPDEAATGFADQLAGALRVAAANVKVQIEFNPSRVTSYRQIGYAKHQLTKEQFRDNTVDAAEIGAAESGNALYVVQVEARGQGPLGIVRARYQDPATGQYHELEWVLPDMGPAPALEESSATLRLAGVASAFSEWLARSPFAGEVSPGRLLRLLEGVPEAFAPDPRPEQLRRMIVQGNALAGR